MTNAISGSLVQTDVAAARTQSTQSTQSSVSAGKAAQGQSQAATGPAYTVSLSGAAKLASQAMQEATETPAQTAKEAMHGDHQAQRLLAKEAAEKKL